MDAREGGLWNCPRAPQFSKETQEMLQMMMQEARLTLRQQKQLRTVVKKEGALPVIQHSRPAKSSPLPSVQARPAGLSTKRQRRSAEMCRSGNSYEREMFHPRATQDREKEKERLQKIFANLNEEPSDTCRPPREPDEKGEPASTDRFQEVVQEIKDRMTFLEEMAALGQRKQFQNIIETEISQKIRELELIDRNYSERLQPNRGGGDRRETPQAPTDSTTDSIHTTDTN